MAEVAFYTWVMIDFIIVTGGAYLSYIGVLLVGYMTLLAVTLIAYKVMTCDLVESS
jgi:hypothetical protein